MRVGLFLTCVLHVIIVKKVLLRKYILTYGQRKPGTV